MFPSKQDGWRPERGYDYRREVTSVVQSRQISDVQDVMEARAAEAIRTMTERRGASPGQQPANIHAAGSQ